MRRARALTEKIPPTQSRERSTIGNASADARRLAVAERRIKRFSASC
jgi:hypothetical protein